MPCEGMESGRGLTSRCLFSVHRVKREAHRNWTPSRHPDQICHAIPSREKPARRDLTGREELDEKWPWFHRALLCVALLRPNCPVLARGSRVLSFVDAPRQLRCVQGGVRKTSLREGTGGEGVGPTPTTGTTGDSWPDDATPRAPLAPTERAPSVGPR